MPTEKIVIGRIQFICLGIVVLILAACYSTPAQSPQFVPETDVYVQLSPAWRTYLQAKDDRDAGASTQLEIGPSIQLFLKPLIKLKDITLFDLDDAKKRALVLETGYRSVTAPGAPTENRMEAVMTWHFPVTARLLVADRNRADLDWKSGKFTWRYRNRLTIERTFSAGGYHLIPYVAAEVYYESQYSKWSTTALYAGCLLPVGKHVQFDPYYEHENNTGKSPNTQQNLVGLAVYFFFTIRSVP
jgi:hypothetical protein